MQAFERESNQVIQSQKSDKKAYAILNAFC